MRRPRVTSLFVVSTTIGLASPAAAAAGAATAGVQ